MRSFVLRRSVDVSGISGSGIVAEGTKWDNNKVSLTWIVGHVKSVTTYDDISEVLEIHGHNGTTELLWVGEEYTPE